MSSSTKKKAKTSYGSVDELAEIVETHVRKAVDECQVIDVHTHLFPDTHGDLMLWGIDELLTYHYCVAEYFMTAPAEVTPGSFFNSSKQAQADLVWKGLFVDRLPLSEATRGVVTVLESLGLGEEMRRKDLGSIRTWFAQQDRRAHVETVFSLAKVRYAVMTNIPFAAEETVHWPRASEERPNAVTFADAAGAAACRGEENEAALVQLTHRRNGGGGGGGSSSDPAASPKRARREVGGESRFRSALRVDPLLSGDWRTVCEALRVSGLPLTADGARQFVRQWCDRIEPEYLMASTPHDFKVDDDPLAAFTGGECNCFANAQAAALLYRGDVQDQGSTAETPSSSPSSSGGAELVGQFGVPSSARKKHQLAALKRQHEASCNAGTLDLSSSFSSSSSSSSLEGLERGGGGEVSGSELLEKVLIPIARERRLPIAIKVGAHRGVNPSLRTGGDGVAVSADLADLRRLLTRYPDVKWLATFLSRTNQHEACVLANKFRNLHLYGCWWYCNNPSIIREITAMRVEMLGLAFTAQHSDSRVLEQLIYKWAHARTEIADVLCESFRKLVLAGWRPTQEEVSRDVERLMGGAYEEFMSK